MAELTGNCKVIISSTTTGTTVTTQEINANKNIVLVTFPATPAAGSIHYVSFNDFVTTYTFNGAAWAESSNTPVSGTTAINPPIHTSRLAAFTALGVGQIFRFSTTNLDGVPSPNNSTLGFT